MTLQEVEIVTKIHQVMFNIVQLLEPIPFIFIYASIAEYKDNNTVEKTYDEGIFY